MLGETDDKWTAAVDRVLELEPDSITIYQMELPFNTTISRDKLKHLGQFEETVAGWDTKRRWVDEAFSRLERAGYHVGSAYTVVKDPAKARFVYRDRLWQGADLAGLGVASFGHVNGVHLQNLDSWETYSRRHRGRRAAAGARLPAQRRRAPDPRVRAAAQEGRGRALLLRRQVRRRRPRSASRRRSRRSQREGYLAALGPDRIALTRAGAAPRRRPAAPLLPAPAHGDSLHLMAVHRLARGPLAAGRHVRTRAPCPARCIRSTSPTRAPGWSRRRRRAIAPDEIPQPYRSLLVHQRDMTLTLEAHFGGRVVLRPLSTFISGAWYYRRVLLAQEYSGRPVEMGAIRMKLAALPRKVQARDPPQPGAARAASCATAASTSRACRASSSRSRRTPR